ncbi:MAG TPA: hypothetical protein VN889_00340 [Solirubrobacteraceae bacterium]|nr:hypothetical protein [Solirubrobacteraceae bacterium]
MRDYERDSVGEGWHDALLMELLADEAALADEREPSSETRDRGRLAGA